MGGVKSMGLKSIGVAALAGLSTAAAGQSLTVSLSFDSLSISIGGTATATLSASFTGQPDGAYLSSVNIDLIASSNAFAVSNVGAVAWNNANLGFDGQGVASGSDILGIDASQFSLIPPVTAGSPIAIMTFTVTRQSEAGIQWTPQVSDGAPFMFSVTGGAFSDQPVSYGIESFTGGFIPGIPSPGVAGLLGLGGLLATRRRR